MKKVSTAIVAGIVLATTAGWILTRGQSFDALLDDALRLRRSGDFEGAERLILPYARDSDAAVRAQALGVLGRIDLSRGDPNGALLKLEQSGKFAEAAGLHRLAAENVLARADIMRRYRGDLAGARVLLNASTTLFERAPERVAEHTYQRGLVERDAGHVEDALRLLNAARERADRDQDPEITRDARSARARIWFALGKRDRAFAELRELVAQESDPCARALLLTTLGWLGLVAETTHAADLDMTPLESAHHAFTHDCPSESEARNAAVNLSLAYFSAGELKRARAFLKEAQSSPSEPTAAVSAYERWLDAELTSKDGSLELALQKYDELVQRVRFVDPDGIRIRIEAGRARVLEELGRIEEAERAYASTEALIEADLDFLPFGFGRDAYLGPHEAVSQRRVELLAARGEVGAALHAARAARTRMLRGIVRTGQLARVSLETRARIESLVQKRSERTAALARLEREAWQTAVEGVPAHRDKAATILQQKRDLEEAILALLPQSARSPRELAVAPGEVVLGLFRAVSGTRVFIASSTNLETWLVGADEKTPLEEWAELLLPRVRSYLKAAKVLSVLLDGTLTALDVHALPFEGQPVFAVVPVVYRVDVQAEAGREKPDSLLVADPRGDLLRARQQVPSLSTLLKTRGKLVSLTGTEAIRSRVLSVLTAVGLFVYEGHSEAAQGDSLSAALLLADSGRLEALDVLMLESAPLSIVLSSCESAAFKGTTQAVGLGLADAFIARGSAVALGTTRPVRDSTAAQVNDALRNDPLPLFDRDHFRRALLTASSASHVADDLASYRILVP